MARRRIKLGIDKDTFTVDQQVRLNICGVSFDTGTSHHTLRIGLSSTNHWWQIVRQHPHTNTGVALDVIPHTTREGHDGEDDLTVTIIANEGTSEQETTEVQYDDILFEGRQGKNKAGGRGGKNKAAAKI